MKTSVPYLVVLSFTLSSERAIALVKYKDSNGTLHFVASEAEVPEEYRKPQTKGTIAADETPKAPPRSDATKAPAAAAPPSADKGDAAGGFMEQFARQVPMNGLLLTQQIKQMRERKGHCKEKQTSFACYKDFVSRNPPLTSIAYGMLMAHVADMVKADLKASAITKPEYPLTLAEGIVVLMENTRFDHFLVNTIPASKSDSSDQKDAIKDELLQYTEAKALAISSAEKLITKTESDLTAKDDPALRNRLADIKGRFQKAKTSDSMPGKQ